MTNRIHRYGPALICLLSIAATSTAAAEVTAAQAIERHLEAVDSGLVVNAAARRVAALQEFYRRRDFRPVWVDRGAPTAAARRLRDVLARADREGLDPDQYDAGEFSPTAPYGIARYDVAQSAAALRYISDLRDGRAATREVEPDLFVAMPTLDPVQTLTEITASEDIATYLGRFVPAVAQYRRLRAELTALRALDAAGGWPRLDVSATLEPGTSGPAVAALRTRLRRTDATLPGGPDGTVFDDALRDAVIRFQRRHGLEPDGVVGPRTRAALNVPVGERTRQILVNMERWRWMPNDLGRRHILVNIAGFELDAVADGTVRRHMKVVVGRPYRRTPVFTAPMTYLEIHPYWHVPPNIAATDLLPKIRNAADFLAGEGFRVFDGWGASAREIDPATIDWATVDPARLPYKLRQDPGPKNALGRIKFMFPNRHNVYLHDTPARELFDRAVRVFSSGCIRVERPRDLALFVLDGQDDWSPEALAAAFDAGRTRTIVLREPLPVHITYQTAWIDGDGVLQFRDDIYERDRVLARILFTDERTAARHP
jgi:murein L,D-transpeptidase YcbB/YkuD